MAKHLVVPPSTGFGLSLTCLFVFFLGGVEFLKRINGRYEKRANTKCRRKKRKKEKKMAVLLVAPPRRKKIKGSLRAASSFTHAHT
jgi:hypothetical protein